MELKIEYNSGVFGVEMPYAGGIIVPNSVEYRYITDRYKYRSYQCTCFAHKDSTVNMSSLDGFEENNEVMLVDTKFNVDEQVIYRSDYLGLNRSFHKLFITEILVIIHPINPMAILYGVNGKFIMEEDLVKLEQFEVAMSVHEANNY